LSAELGIDLFTKYPRERTWFEADAAPAGWSKLSPEQKQRNGWKPIHTEDDRVMAAWIYYSWCYPVGLPYAVEIDEDDELRKDRYGQPLVMTQERLGALLGVQQPNVVRATHRLELRGLLRVDDGRVYPIAKPELSPEDRRIATAGSDDAGAPIDEKFRPIPPEWRQPVAELIAALKVERGEDTSTDILNRILAHCTRFNEQLTTIRAERDQGLEKASTEAVSLLSRHIDLRKRAAVAQGSSSSGPPAHKTSSDANGETPDKLLHRVSGPTPASVLYEAIPEWQKQYPRSPFATPHFSSLGKADRQLTQRIVAALGEADATAFVAYVHYQFAPQPKGRGRSPYDPGGPQKLGLLVEWARDFSAEHQRNHEEMCAEAARQVLIEADRKRELEEWAREIEADSNAEPEYRALALEILGDRALSASG